MPLALIDVDGVLNPFRRSRGFRRHEVAVGGETYRLNLNRRHGRALLALAHDTDAQLVWATTWEDKANEEIGPRIGLPNLPVIEVGREPKAYAVAAYVKGRPFVWFDDAHQPADQQYLAEHPGVGEFLLVKVDPGVGLTGAHLDQARAWLVTQ
ncbi:hypothetical protein J5X84_31970 [Streptosporangiaceae bacterium NEAU-GS5]|nr:hypothetical protein [Streptosporangiaceae bacterium NEAU-GS5]